MRSIGEGGRYTDIEVPQYLVYPAPAEKRTGQAVLIFPGGGYGILAMNHEGHDYAKWLNERGITGVVVKYRVTGKPELGYQFPVPFLDARRAIRTVRANAAEWGVDLQAGDAGGLCKPVEETPVREVWLLQRKASKLGATLGKTSGWVHRATLLRKGVQMIAGVEYNKIDDRGLYITVEGEERLLEVDTVILCAGQLSNRTLFDELIKRGVNAHVIGGADVAAELDALRAIDQATRLAVSF